MGTSSVGRGLARHRMAQDKAAKDSSDKAASAPKGEDGGKTSMHDHAGEAGSHEVIHSVVAEHGPATTSEMKQEGAHHTVKTTHEDGHEHTSKGHPSVAHAAEHMKIAAGDSEGGDEGKTDAGEGSENEGAGGLQDMGLGEYGGE
jgi:hypothetical protein